MNQDKNPRNAGRKKIPGKSRHIICSDEEFEQIKQLLKSIREKK